MANQTATGATVGQEQVSVNISVIKYFAEFILDFDDKPLCCSSRNQLF